MKYSISGLEKYSLDQLQELAQKLNLSAQGTKEELAQQISSKYWEIHEDEDSVRQQIQEDRKARGFECNNEVDPILQESVNEFPDDRILFLPHPQTGQKIHLMEGVDEIEQLLTTRLNPFDQIPFSQEELNEIQRLLNDNRLDEIIFLPYFQTEDQTYPSMSQEDIKRSILRRNQNPFTRMALSQEEVNRISQDFVDKKILFLPYLQIRQKTCFVKEKAILEQLLRMGRNPLNNVPFTSEELNKIQEALNRGDYTNQAYPWNRDTLEELFIVRGIAPEEEDVYDFYGLVRKMAESYPEPTPLIDNWLQIYGSE